MEVENTLLDRFETNFKYGPETRKLFWKTFFKRSWGAYCITFIFEIIYVVWYLITPAIILIYYCILWPILMIILFFLMGLYRSHRYKVQLTKIMKNVKIDIYTEYIQITWERNGVVSTDKCNYSTMKRISFNEKTQEMEFLSQNNNLLSVNQQEVKPDTFDFLKTLLK
ncbi:MAG: hypothetical protein K2J85_02155 [Anaeroplasmataceae bacterium]|nr:hypothetical protein [Anaeroplasmataceae bacterium]